MENLRTIETKKLSLFLKNPGFFSILIIGDSGTGKEYQLKMLFKDIIEEEISRNISSEPKDELMNKKVKFIYPFELGETELEISKLFEFEYIIIKNTEELSDNQQNILHKAMSTVDGKIGLNENMDYKRIIFTSSYNIDELREGNKRLLNRFWDRISQLVIKIPSFKEFSSNISEDFKSVWEKMKFEEYPKNPEDGEFREWLTQNCGSFSGNFRDLDKIAILWHQYRILEYKEQKFKSDIEARIFRKVRNDFESFTHFPKQSIDLTNVYEFEMGKKWEQIEREFKSKFKSWAKKAYPSIKQATSELNMPSRKMDKW